MHTISAVVSVTKHEEEKVSYNYVRHKKKQQKS